MQQDMTTEQRLARLERQVAELERDRRMQEARDIALLARIDGFIEDLRRVERVQLKAFDGLEAQLQEQGAEFKEQGSSLDLMARNMAVLAEAAKDHKSNIEGLALVAREHQASIQSVAGDVQTILDLLRGGQSKIND